MRVTAGAVEGRREGAKCTKHNTRDTPTWAPGHWSACRPGPRPLVSGLGVAVEHCAFTAALSATTITTTLTPAAIATAKSSAALTATLASDF